ncbi:MAG: DUF3090 family protein [Chloroflexi bacterium]|nr:MAG: DUF3090 family protein [Chloroflexota bacterium]
MGRNFELDPVEELAVAAVGDPGQRRFFLLAGGAGERATLACEKFHIQGLVARIQQLLETQGLGAAFDPTPARNTPAVEAEDWTIGELGLGYHESRKLFVIVAREQLGEGEETEEAATARFWAGADRVRAFSRQAEQVLSSGRPVCTYCGLPIDPAGHPCPASNGSRPIF